MRDLLRSLLHIGAVYTELRLYKEAEESFKRQSIFMRKRIQEITSSYRGLYLIWVIFIEGLEIMIKQGIILKRAFS